MSIVNSTTFNSELEKLKGVGNSIVIDVETNGLDPYGCNQICGVGVGDSKAEGFTQYYPFRHHQGENLTNEHLKELQSLLNMTNNLQYNIGKLEGQKHSLLHELSIMQKRIIDMQDTLSKEYGTYDVDVTNGTINRKEDEK